MTWGMNEFCWGRWNWTRTFCGCKVIGNDCIKIKRNNSLAILHVSLHHSDIEQPFDVLPSEVELSYSSNSLRKHCRWTSTDKASFTHNLFSIRFLNLCPFPSFNSLPPLSHSIFLSHSYTHTLFSIGWHCFYVMEMRQQRRRTIRRRRREIPTFHHSHSFTMRNSFLMQKISFVRSSISHHHHHNNNNNAINKIRFCFII